MRSSFSSTRTREPARATLSAALSPATPAPMTTTSKHSDARVSTGLNSSSAETAALRSRHHGTPGVLLDKGEADRETGFSRILSGMLYHPQAFLNDEDIDLYELIVGDKDGPVKDLTSVRSESSQAREPLLARGLMG